MENQAGTVSIIVLDTPKGSTDAPLPQILLYQNGVWREVANPEYRAGVNALTYPKTIERTMHDLMVDVEAGEEYTADDPQLKGAGDEYYDFLVPDEVKKALTKAANESETPTLLIHTHPTSEWIPWEILHDKKEYLGLKFQIARLPILREVPDVKDEGPLRVSNIYNLLGRDFLDDEEQQDKWMKTFNGLNPQPTVFNQIPATFAADAVYPKVEQMTSAIDADILHITCHGGLMDPDKGSYWTLGHNNTPVGHYRLYRQNLRTIGFVNKPLVFGNACASSGVNGPVADQSSPMTGFATDFFANGALNFVGTFAPITKKLAVEFAGQFYKYLLSPGALPIGKALFKAKQHFYNEQRADPSYLFYCLYGRPETTFQVVAND